ncbi:hypothetical protein L3C95_29935 [Chitinophaga filiformis]|uniref:hypothetical protein n=1 Tax=Chitinophaga filiformis TaxID=104663 RepID=UPI001F178BB4|nr:hypothetical protein [Chitinophaga filiformis]MCF6407154.1 hypothetical protein [Chitinophaga filiformis]
MTMNKHLAALYVVAACILGCKEPAVTNGEEKGTTPLPTTDTMMAVADTIEPTQVASWQAFEQFEGKYVAESGMLEREPLKSRIQALLDTNSRAFAERFDVTPPVEVENDILYNQGCRRHFCGGDEAALAIDMRRDVIYVGIAINGAVKLYSERNDSAFPEKLLRWKLKFPSLN